jgi:hypothetical protein
MNANLFIKYNTIYFTKYVKESFEEYLKKKDFYIL